MKRFTIFAGALAVAFCLSSIPAFAQTTTAERRAENRTGGATAGQLDSKTVGSNVRVSQLMGLNIQNSRGESVGEIKDLVIDSNTGKVRYAAVTYGGFLGLGDKLFAVPFEAFKVQRNPDDPGDVDDYVMVLDVTQEQLKGATGFDQDHWPNMADKGMLRELDTRYGVERKMGQDRNNRDTNVDVNVNRNGVDVDVNRKRNQ